MVVVKHGALKTIGITNEKGRVRESLRIIEFLFLILWR